MPLAKATIEILSDPGKVIEVQFNPNTLVFRKDAVVAEIGIPGLNSPILQYVRGDAETLDLELFCDTTRDGMGNGARDVSEFTAPIRRLVDIDPAFNAIPIVRFSWGTLHFTAVVVGVEQTFTLFSPAGVPLRAMLRLRLKEYKTLADQVTDKPPRTPRPAAHRQRIAPGAQLALPHIDIQLNGKSLGVTVVRDLLQLQVHSDLVSRDVFELTFNNWDEERADFKYSDAGLFDPGDEIVIDLGKADQPIFKGRIDTIEESRPPDGQPTLTVAGGATTRRRPKRSKPATIRLRYGESLIRFSPKVTLAQQAGKKGTRSGTPRVRTQITATGTVIGIPELRTGTAVEITREAERFRGAYHVTRAVHTIDDSGYTVDFELRKDDE